MASPPKRARTCSLIAAGLLFIAFAAPLSVDAQVEDDLARLALDNAELYVQPLAHGLGYAMNGGLFDRGAPMRQWGFDIGVRVMAAIPSEASKTFQAILPGEVTWNHPVFGPTPYTNPYTPRGNSRSTPSASGEGPGVVLEPTGQFRDDLILAGRNPNDFNIEFPEGLDIPAVPFAVAHASLGIGFGTELTLRMIPEVEVHEDVGSLSSMGFGIQHAITHWFASPVDVSVALGRQSISVGDYLDGSSSQYGLMVGKGFGPLTLYGSGMMRSSTLDVSYTVENPEGNPGLPEDGTEFAFSSEIDSGMAIGLGARIQLLFMNISGQYTIDDYSGFSLKVGFGLP